MKFLICLFAFVAGCAGNTIYSYDKCQEICHDAGYPDAAYVEIDDAKPCDKCQCSGGNKSVLYIERKAK